MGEFAPVAKEIEDAAAEVIDAAFAIHRKLGPGLLESVYEACLVYELQKRNVTVRSQVAIPVIYDELRLENGFRVDLVVADSMIVELKAVEQVLPVHEAQLLTYLKLTNLRLGLLINFNVPLLKSGIRRLVR